jgi:putative ABC transport system permease protein
MLTGFGQDIRQGLRALVHRPAFTAVAVATLALGIGATTTMFSVVHAVLVRPLRFADPSRLVLFRDLQPHDLATPLSYPEFTDWRARREIFSDFGGWTRGAYVLSGDPAENVWALRVSANLLPMLGIQPALGRGFRADEERRGAAPVALISDALWRRRFGADPSVLGRSIALSGAPFTIVGVLPPGVDTILPWDRQAGAGRDIVAPLQVDETTSPRGMHFLDAVARLGPGIDLADAARRADAFAEGLKRDGVTDHGVRLLPLQAQVVGGVRPALLVLLGAAGLVLLIACANLANLLLVRGMSRRREIAVRMALGAGRARLLRQLMVESLVLAAVGGGLGLLLAAWGADFLAAGRADWLPRAEEIRVDPAVLGFAAAATILTGLLFGLLPAWRVSGMSLAPALRGEGGRGDGSGGGAGGGDRLRGVMVVSELALSLVLLAGAGLLLRSFAVLSATDPGFDPRHALTFQVSGRSKAYDDPDKQVDLFDRILADLATLPGVEGVAAVNSLPVGGGTINGGFDLEGKEWATGDEPVAEKQIVSPDYFRVMRVPVVRGRAFTTADIATAPHVAMVNQAFVDTFLPGVDPIGKHLGFNWGIEGRQEIVGVVADIRQGGLDEPAPPATYVVYPQRPIETLTVVIRSTGPPAALLAAARGRLRAIDPELPPINVRTLDEMIGVSLAPRRLPMLVLGGMALLALVLAAVGIYGVTSYAVAQRIPEFGVRMALGARPRDLMGMVLAGGVRLVAAGAVLGLAGALAVTRLLRALLYGVGSTDLATFAAATAFLALVALAACLVPARRATRVDPMVALRSE